MKLAAVSHSKSQWTMFSAGWRRQSAVIAHMLCETFISVTCIPTIINQSLSSLVSDIYHFFKSCGITGISFAKIVWVCRSCVAINLWCEVCIILHILQVGRHCSSFHFFHSVIYLLLLFELLCTFFAELRYVLLNIFFVPFAIFMEWNWLKN